MMNAPERNFIEELQGRVLELLMMTRDGQHMHHQFMREQDDRRKDMFILMLEGNAAIRKGNQQNLGVLILEMAAEGLLDDLITVPEELARPFEPPEENPLADNETVVEFEDQHE